MNAPITQAAEGLSRRAFTVAEVERMIEVGLIPPDERLEIIGGEIVPMSPRGNRHEAVKAAITLLWGRRCPEDFVFVPETGLRLDEFTYLEPDFVVFSGKVELASLSGPDILLAIEVADSSLAYDLGRKSKIYADYGVRELWVVNAAQRVVHTHLGAGRGGYAWTAERSAWKRLEPTHAPREFAFALDELRRL